MAKRRILDPLPQLAGDQALASEPKRQVRLSASAGTGKTQVLSARVMRLLLQGVKPESILCITFTKAGAAEMADRIHERLGAWVTMKQAELSTDLMNLGEDHGSEARESARTLFARVLDARGSGLRIQTIHSFAQSLLASFPAEAGLAPGFRAIEGREEEQLAARALSDMVTGFEAEGRLGDLDRLKLTAKRLSEEATRAFLRRCASHPDALEQLPADEGIGAYIRRSLTGNLDDIESTLRLVCDEGGFDRPALEAVQRMHQNWFTKAGTPTVDGQKAAARIAAWLNAPVGERIETLADLRRAWRKADGEWFTKQPPDEDYRPMVECLDAWIERLIMLHTSHRISLVLADALIIGRAYARAYTAAKAAAGAVDFNDLIRSTVRLLQTPGIGEWIRFKLDQSVDHILVDEAQDTNANQWTIVKALAEEFFAGEGAKGEAHRTLFTVGDFKQAIFGFQGTDPRAFDEAGRYFAAQIDAADQQLLDLSLSQSFRSSQPILDVTDALINDLGWEALGLVQPPEPHQSFKGGSGSVTLLPPELGVAEGAEVEDEDEAEEGWLATSELVWAEKLAARIHDMTTGGLRLRNQDRGAQAGDVMILVRSRGELARLIVSRLYEAGVPVAGVDRLQLGAPIAVQDLLACIRFALQPKDDLSLACLLVSPLIGWSQEQLYTAAKCRKGALWDHLGDDKPWELKQILSMADLATPFRFLEAILTGPIQGRRKIVARLGEEARDPVEALLSAAIDFERQATPSLQLFLDWFDKGDVEIKRDPSKPENAVRVMTVHGAKGLQAPIVILADATSDPNFKRKTDLNWVIEEGLNLPLFRPKKEDRVASLAESAERQDAREMEEHWRLLYVALTRAEEHLIIGGALKPKQIEKGMSDACWHFRVGNALTTMGVTKGEDGALVLQRDAPLGRKRSPEGEAELWKGAMPIWAITPAPPEARPPRPLAPSAAEIVDSEANPPPTPERRAAARRGTLLHSLFERLPGVEPARRKAAALNWLEHSGGVENAVMREEMVDAALAVISNSEFADIFSANALAEAPIAGVVDGRVITGAVDRLLISPDGVTVIDFKTGLRVPEQESAVSRHHIAQMAAYVAVLKGMFGDRPVRAALLYTSGPRLIPLSDAILQGYKPGFSAQQQELPLAG